MSGSTSSSNVIGSGSDTIVLNMSEDQAEGIDAQFTVNVDGQQIGGVQTVTASHAAGQDETFTLQGNYGTGPHDVAVTFLNNFIYPGDAGDRNLYVDGVTYDGQTISNTTTPIYNAPLFPPTSTEGPVYGNAVFAVNDTTPIPAGASPNPTSTPSPVSVGSGPDTLALNMSEDAYLGDAQFTVSVDGQQIGGTQTTTAIQDQGQSQEFDVQGNFGPGTHTVSVTFLNDLVGGFYPAGTPGLPPGGPWAIDTEDRNLYVMGASLDGGAPASGLPWEQSGDGTETFTVTAGSNPSATGLGSGLFATDGAAADGNNVAITAGSLSAGTTTSGSSSGMSFVAPTTSTTTATTTTAATTASTATSSTDPSSTDPSSGSSGGTGTAVDTTPSVASAVSGTSPTTQDWSAPSTTGSSTSDTTSGTSGSNWWATHQNAGGSGWAFHQPG